jgi:hypothetical protein
LSCRNPHCQKILDTDANTTSHIYYVGRTDDKMTVDPALPRKAEDVEQLLLVKTEDAPKPRMDSLTDPLEMKPSGPPMTTGSQEPGTSWPQNMEQISEFKRRSPFPEMASDDAEAALMKIEGGFTPSTDEGSEPRTEGDGQLSSRGLALEDDTGHVLTETSEGVRMEIQLDALSFVKIGIQGNIQDMTSQNFMQCLGQIKIFKGIHKFYLLTSSIDHLRMQVHIFLDHIFGFFWSPL